MSKPSVILIGADKGGVGKTTVARSVLDYMASKNVLTRAFDTEC
jgi:cellulose biosynthesis protein BcsQ